MATAKQKAASRRNLVKARAAKAAKAPRSGKHESVGSMAQKDRVAARHGMSVEEFKKKMAADSRRERAALKAQMRAKFADSPPSTYRMKSGHKLPWMK